MRRLPPLIELRAFEAAARQLSFKLAANELGVTPTAVSHQIRLLEQYCGQRLFRRQPRPLSLTAAGKQLFPTIQDGFNRIAEALADVGAVQIVHGLPRNNYKRHCRSLAVTEAYPLAANASRYFAGYYKYL